MNTIWDILEGTPTWVWVLFIYLMIIGFKARKIHVVSLFKLFILPALFFILAIYYLIVNFSSDVTAIFIWIIAFGVGTVLNWIIYKNLTLQADKKKHLIKVPGTWSVLIMIILIFSIKYTFGYLLSAHPTIIHNSLFIYSFLIASGIITGLFLGKALRFLEKFRKAPHVDLVEKRKK